MVATPTPVSGCIDVRTVKSSHAVELYILAAPTRPAPAADQAKETCAAISRVLQAHDAWIMEERVFASSNALEFICAVRSRTYAPRAGGVTPLRIEIAPGGAGEVAGIQVHAVCGTPQPEVLCLDEAPVGRVLRNKDAAFLTLSAITSPEAGAPEAQAFRSFEKAEQLLKQAGGDFFSVARTWWWLDRICSWYGEFNHARSAFFTQRGLLTGKPTTHRMPASTGIGMQPLGGPACALDVVAIIAPKEKTRCFNGAGNQHSAFNYGSAFSRVSRTNTPGGETVFVSGTAAIDAKGTTTHVGDAAGQIDDTIQNVCAVLKDMQCRDDDVVHAIAYCKTPEVEQVWNKTREKLGWPFITVLADVCREELLFEVEATACPGAKRA
ncbi:MAG: Rid family hydrolase [Planctomycetota bacterium]|nr:Rid family hydrolase [Planctomycetota bacterium]